MYLNQLKKLSKHAVMELVFFYVNYDLNGKSAKLLGSGSTTAVIECLLWK